MTRKLLLISSSRVHGFGFLESAADSIRDYLNKYNVKTVLFIPYANTKYDDYLSTVQTAFQKLNLGQVRGIHEGEDPVAEVNKAEAVFIGGGNTFLLLKTLYEQKLIAPIRDRVLRDGVPYIGSSAGTNVATVSIHTTNDMPIVEPPSFKALNLVPFNINPHYLDPTPDSRHMGETRPERILQFTEMPDCNPVLAIREGSSVLVEGSRASLLGEKAAVLFKKGGSIEEVPVGADISYLLA